MKKIHVGIIGFGIVGSGAANLLKLRKNFIRNRYNTEFNVKTICDLYIKKMNTKGLGKVKLTTKYQDIIDDEGLQKHFDILV